MKVHINYAHGRYLKSQQLCCQTALQHGADKSIAYGLQDIDPDFIQKNAYTFSMPRGAGCWLWKPYLILKTLQTLRDEDWLMYTDAGMYFVKNPWPMIQEQEPKMGEKGILTFGTCNLNRVYTKRDTFVLMGADEPKYTDSEHRMASIFVCKKTPFSLAFVETWLRCASDPRILTDLPNTRGLPNYPEFKDHRHDQSVMSILTIKYDTHYLGDITQFGMPQDPYLNHTRNPS